MIAAKPLTELSDNELRDLLVKAHRDRKLAEYQDGMMAYQMAVDAAVNLQKAVKAEFQRRLRNSLTEQTIMSMVLAQVLALDIECRKEADGR